MIHTTVSLVSFQVVVALALGSSSFWMAHKYIMVTEHNNFMFGWRSHLWLEGCSVRKVVFMIRQHDSWTT
jgi:hypothetical protein